jgi:hypothetical protein
MNKYRGNLKECEGKVLKQLYVLHYPYVKTEETVIFMP